MDLTREVNRRMSRVWKVAAGVVGVALVATVGLVAGGGLDARGRTAAAVEISRPAPEVFAYLVTPELLTKWLGGLIESRPTSQPWPRVGAKALERVGAEDDAHELEVEVTALEPNRLLELSVTHPEFTTRARYALRERDGRTVLIYEAQSAYTHPITRILSPLVERRAQTKLEEDFLRLKLALEGPPRPVAVTPSGEAPTGTAGQPPPSPSTSEEGAPTSPPAAAVSDAPPVPEQPAAAEPADAPAAEHASEPGGEPASGTASEPATEPAPATGPATAGEVAAPPASAPSPDEASAPADAPPPSP